MAVSIPDHHNFPFVKYISYGSGDTIGWFHYAYLWVLIWSFFFFFFECLTDHFICLTDYIGFLMVSMKRL